MKNKAKIITFWSAKGGVGKTTLAIAEAIMLSREEKDKVVLLDFNEVTPDIHRMLGLKPIDLTQIYDGIEQKSITSDLIKPYLQKKHGVWVLTGVGLREFDRFEERHFLNIIYVLSQEFSHVIIDCNAGIFFASTLAALKSCDTVKVVAVPTKFCIEDTVKIVDFVQGSWEVEGKKIKIILNMARSVGADPENVKALFEDFGDIDVIGYDPAAIESQESGKVFIPQEMNISKTRKKPRNGLFSLLLRERRRDVVTDKSV